ncbi:hypothetical protein A2697_01610 [Candidatus Curtissbacteria bacterium RIFCSPHIGHO2_01_FULL_41_44]|uniref:Glycosyltransferase 2-like domain-containing protein n=1 Tax=Candidatus Curtissbacteria bacterium RIFCSPLOWO2_01_FULL_42_50 TaxID=1797730 RepID=A0A1F5H6C7_9BACT|nr:MAG: hypothetical protein A2697_01610 [Candidatus Curtissbacteria bacterium RIFCSPHIGHO2_01_FULL_41_44]OGD99627.1 MAG: hypothetical protein A3B54_02985 [Candidatus Curtissbacteria bacterium RIFCSPLOWO2_01_FULL_42_50]
MKTVIVVPAFNESAAISKVLTGIPKKLKGISQLSTLVVDDGSGDNTSQKAKKAGVFVVRHVINRGLGAAIKTGLDWAKSQGADIAVTFDSDGQHDPTDIPRLIQPILNKDADLVIGSRFKKKQSIPADRLILNWFANLTTLVMFGVHSTDSQSGLRAFSKKAMAQIDLKADRMDFSSEILIEAKRHNLKIEEIPIKAIYTDYSRKKGQKNLNAIPVFARILIRFLR